jgi:drug/metabolite transporter (DMT)-like permease
MLFAGASFASMGVLVKLGAQWFSSHELVFYRAIVGLLLMAATLLRHRGSLVSPHPFLHLRRSLVGFIALTTFFYAVAHLPLSLAISLNYTAPLFLALLMPWQLGERPSRAQYATVAVGFVGVVLLLLPWQTTPHDLIAGLIGLFSGVMAAFAYVHVRQLGRLGEPEWRTVFWFSVVCSLGAGSLAGLDGWHTPANRWPLLLGIGLFATLGQLGMTRAYRKGKTVLVATYAYSTVVFGSILDTLIFRTEMPIISWIGMLTTVLAGIRVAQLTRSNR